MTPSLPDGATESDTERDGFLSYAAEWHAFALGVGGGLTWAVTGRVEVLAAVAAVAFGLRQANTAHFRDVRKEAAYAVGGLVLGALLGTLLVTVV